MQDENRCPICNVCFRDRGLSSEDQMLQHVNECLDKQTSTVAAPQASSSSTATAVAAQITEEVRCYTCGKNLTTWTLDRRLMHTNRCMDEDLSNAAKRGEGFDTAKNEVNLYERNLVCKFCKRDLTSLSIIARIGHWRGCSRDATMAAAARIGSGGVQTVAILLGNIGLQRYEKSVTSTGLGIRELLEMGDEGLTAMGVDTVGARKKILEALKLEDIKMRQQAAETFSEPKRRRGTTTTGTENRQRRPRGATSSSSGGGGGSGRQQQQQQPMIEQLLLQNYRYVDDYSGDSEDDEAAQQVLWCEQMEIERKNNAVEGENLKAIVTDALEEQREKGVLNREAAESMVEALFPVVVDASTSNRNDEGDHMEIEAVKIPVSSSLLSRSRGTTSLWAQQQQQQQQSSTKIREKEVEEEKMAEKAIVEDNIEKDNIEDNVEKDNIEDNVEKDNIEDNIEKDDNEDNIEKDNNVGENNFDDDGYLTQLMAAMEEEEEEEEHDINNNEQQ